MILELRDDRSWFPDTALADEDGLLAFGGDLSHERLLNAYRRGIFPWYNSDTPILWYSPHQRFVLFPSEIHITKSMNQVIRSGKFEIKRNTAFAEVIQNCAGVSREGQDGTWITNEMQEAYIGLHREGYAHSIEAWHNNELVGGLYGVETGNIFCGESMFSKESNASKAALIWLAQNFGYKLIDCQVPTDHLKRMGAKMISREEYEMYLSS
jgi:leucyl/phenylalanyl-tRNA--protein transferase